MSRYPSIEAVPEHMRASVQKAMQEQYGRTVASVAEKVPRHKYGAKPVTVDGVKYHSTGEADRYQVLEHMQAAGIITNLQRQKSYDLVVNGLLICRYVSDYEYDEDGQHVVEDYKGFITPEYTLKAKLMKACHGIIIKETGKRARKNYSGKGKKKHG